MPVAAAILASTVIGAGASAIQAKQQQVSQGRSQRRAIVQQKKQSDLLRQSQVREQRQQQEADRASRRFTQGKARELRNQNLARRRITPFGSDVSEAILNERARTV